MSKNLDIKDWKILSELCTDSRMSHNRIAKQVGLGKNSVTYRVQRLEKMGVISGFSVNIDWTALGITSCNILVRLDASKERESEFIQYIKSHPNVPVFDRFLGDWDFLIEFGSRDVIDFHNFLSGLQGKFSDIIETFEIHPVLKTYKVEQLSVEQSEKLIIKPFRKILEPVKVDKKDLELLKLLDENSTSSFFQLGEKLGITYETVSARAKRLKEIGVILKFTANINLHALGYDVYLVLLELKNLSTEREALLKTYINSQKNIRYAFMSSHKPVLFIYAAVKNADALNTFLLKARHVFREVLVSQKYLFGTEQIKCELFPTGFVEA